MTASANQRSLALILLVLILLLAFGTRVYDLDGQSMWNDEELSVFQPTAGWREGEVIVDNYQIAVPSGTAPGPYRLWIGLYDPATNTRLPLFSGGQRLLDDRLDLTEVTIKP